jgi:uncharacterized membrane protein YfcA
MTLDTTAEWTVSRPAEPSSKWQFMPILIALCAMVAVLCVARGRPDKLAGLEVGQLVALEAILFASGVVSGLSGFGFSAIGAASFLLIHPLLGVPLLQSLSAANQLLSLKQLRGDMPRSLRAFWEGPGPCILGGAIGAPLGIWTLANLPTRHLTVALGALLVLYAAYSLLKRGGASAAGTAGPASGAAVGLLGGAIGGCTAFPGAAVVVWTGLLGLPKAQNRAIVQPYIIMSQVYALALIAWLHPALLDRRFWLLLLLSLPAVLSGTLCGVTMYRRISDVDFKRVCFALLGLSGAALLLRTYGPAIAKVL